VTQRAAVGELRDFLCDPATDDAEQVFPVGSIFEAISRLDPALVPVDMIEDIAESDDFSKRSSAAVMLWERAEVAPADVPLSLLGRLARPA
jgi:hypothetical protein